MDLSCLDIARAAKLAGLKKVGEEHLFLCPNHDDHHPSLSINPRKDVWMCGPCGASGTAWDLAAFIGGWESSDKHHVVRWLREHDLLRGDGSNGGITVFATSKCEEMWKGSIPITDEDASPARAYLRRRGLDTENLPPAIRFGRLDYFHGSENRGQFPAIIAKVTSIGGQGFALLQTYLNDDGDKADVPAVKKALRPVKGNAIQLDRPEETVAITEGLETGLAVREATGLPTLVAISSSGLKAVQLPDPVKTVHIWGDLDPNQIGQNSAQELANRLIGEERTVYVHLPRPPTQDNRSIDWLDVFNEDGREALREVLKNGKPYEASLRTESHWAKRAPLPELLPEAPSLPERLLPDSLRPWLADVSRGSRFPLSSLRHQL